MITMPMDRRGIEFARRLMWRKVFNSRAVMMPRNISQQEQLMLDILMLALGLGFFVLTVGYAYACERL
ncbi:hypothetical protein ONR75_18360 [Rhodopseudomonas sp. P2A-2r]|uniref:hypothetical protein n=1 Tax=Rhodopseudomonas sp. P2A-2r TaxID=2991972 RepID=UPI002234649A|nr:hypothetical protein [Rhodopseudomonas sp. P2A-2r]UZE46972.1 hypothetical protein ONR75_18360 [Rhodopseudomonas sp. P2A-2r]